MIRFDNRILSAVDSKSKLQLGLELTVEKRKNEILMNKLREAKKQIKMLEQRGKLFYNLYYIFITYNTIGF